MGWEGRRGEWPDVIAHISSQTVCLRARGSVSQSISIALCWITGKVCAVVWCCVHTHTIIQSSKCSWLTACQLLFNTSRLTYSLIPPPCSRLEKGKNEGKKMERWWSGGLEWERWRRRGGGRKELREWENQRWAWGFREVMICLAACAQPPPQWHNRTMYSKGFKYLYSDLMFLYTHTHTDTVKSLERAEVKLSVLDYHRLFPLLPFFHMLISLLLHGWCQWWCRCLSRLVRCSVAESLMKMAGANRIVSQSSSQPGSLSNALSNHCDGQLSLCEDTINIL